MTHLHTLPSFWTILNKDISHDTIYSIGISSAVFNLFGLWTPIKISLYSVDPLLLTVTQNFESCGPPDIFCGPLKGPWTPGWEPLD